MLNIVRMSHSDKATVQVAVRVRPQNKRESNTKDIISNTEHNVYIVDPDTSTKKTFTYDFVYGVDSVQSDIYQDVGLCVLNNAYHGYNTCVFAYGQTGSGKSYTMMGLDKNTDGLIPKICQQLFERQSDHNGIPSNTPITYKLEVSYVEIYSEEVRDLLSKTPNSNLKIREHPQLGPYIEGVSQILVEDYKTIKKLIDQGNKERATASTLMNSRSSRSHAILTLSFTQIMSDIKHKHEIVSKINLVDLAGSERVEMSGVVGINFKEAININKSLSSLGIVISKLAAQSKAPVKKTIKIKSKVKASPKGSPFDSPKDSPREISKQANHIPYRDSVLTWILKESLGGNSKTYVIANVSPSALNYNESLSTLRFASNAKQIVNRVKVNEDSHDKLIRVLKDEIAALKAQLASKQILTMSDEDLTILQDELAQREELMREKDKSWEQKLQESNRVSAQIQEELKKELDHKTNELENLKTLIVDKELDNQSHKLELEKKQLEIDELRIILEDEKTIKLAELEQKQADFEKRQAEFEKERIVGAALSMQEYYDEKVKKIQQEYDVKSEKLETEFKEKLEKLETEFKEKSEKLETEFKEKSEKLETEFKNKLHEESSKVQIEFKEKSEFNKQQLEAEFKNKLHEESNKLENEFKNKQELLEAEFKEKAEKLEKIQLENSKLQTENSKLQLENSKLQTEIVIKTTQIEFIQSDCKKQQELFSKQQEEFSKQQSEFNKQQAEFNKQQSENNTHRTISAQKQANAEIQELTDQLISLKKENKNLQARLQLQTTQATNERVVFSKQIQQLHAKIHSLENAS